MGETAKAFTQADLDFDGSALAFIIKQHEAESLLPNRVIEEAMRDESYAPEKFDALDRIIEVSAQDFDAKCYIDHKNGLNAKKAMSLDSKHGVFWSNIPLVNRHMTHMNCQNPCPNCSAPCNIIDGLGENILLHSLSKLSVMTSQKINEVIEPQLKDLWCDLGKLLYSWGCSPVKSTSRS
ncbi:hypothetical protein [Aeromonas veronii]|uniref:hypothetical protein n=1 Tax=Aeromonas veronii TaxID=654 RepID=UPI00191EA8C7|nr:hypothetical protein [Aeromonas veronii]MBL0563906.1 hypothetical protein [Aeromonas veronii]